MARKHLNIGGKIQARRKAMGLSQEDLAQLIGVSRQSVTKWETGQSAPDLDRLVELADMLGVSLDFLLREPLQKPSSSSSSSSSSSLSSGHSSFLIEDGTQDTPPVSPEAAQQPLPPFAAGGVPFCEEASAVPCGESGGPSRTAAPPPMPFSGVSEASPGLPETSFPEPEAACFPAPASLPCPPAPAGYSYFQSILCRMAVLGGIVLSLIGGLGLLSLWTLSELYPVQLTDWDGSRHTGLWGFLLVHEIRSLFWLASGLLASGGLVVAGAWRAR